jgi:hypothetical protein
MSFDDYNYK